MIAPNVYKVYQSIARPYINLANTFELRDLNRLNAEIDAARNVWSAVSPAFRTKAYFYGRNVSLIILLG
jgi:COP9 signalosome complex subunit 3